MLDYASSTTFDNFSAKDLQELFIVEKRASFLKFVALLFAQSGMQYEATALATVAEISRQTAQNYLAILETTLLVHVLRPYSGNVAREVKTQPKVYGFDTGFVCFFKSIDHLRPEDRGVLLEHLVLNELAAHFSPSQLFYWRDKAQHEVDFVIKPARGNNLIAIECKTKPTKFTADNLRSFRGIYPEGINLVVCLDLAEPYEKKFNDLVVRFVPFNNVFEEVITSFT